MSTNSNSSSSRPQSPFAPLQAFFGSFAEVNTPLLQLNECIENTINQISRVASQIADNESENLNAREFLLNELGILPVQKKYKEVRKEFNTHVTRTAQEVLRLPVLRPPVQLSDQSSNTESCGNSVVDSLDSTFAQPMEVISSATSTANNDESIVWVSTLHGYAKCRLCQIDCPELTRTHLFVSRNIDASVLCSSCFERVVPSLMSIEF